MRRPRGLVVFEGPDGVGKSSIVSGVAKQLRRDGLDVVTLSFPGKEPGTLGELVYRLHHDRMAFELRELTEEALQLLHVAAHIDAIQSRIRPAIKRGALVLLDRYWWSTAAYGSTRGANQRVLDQMIALEVEAWGDLVPKTLFLVRRPIRLQAKAKHPSGHRLTTKYRALAKKDALRYPIEHLVNDRSLAEVVGDVVTRIMALASGKCPTHAERPATRQLDLGLVREAAVQRVATLATRFWSPAEPTVVFDTYWRFAAERQRSFFRRLEGAPWPWTSDPILQTHKFTNAYRAADRVSQYLIRNVIYHGSQEADEVFFRTLLFKFFNRADTWELLEREVGPPSLGSFSPEKYGRVLREAMQRGSRIYSAAYIMPAAERTPGVPKHDTHLRLLARMVDEGLPARLSRAGLLREAFEMLRSYPMMGDFLAYQYVIDLNYGPLLDFSEMEFVVPGPGARDGISKCFRSLGGLNEAEIIRLVAQRQGEEFARVGEHFPSLWGRPLQLVDCQSLFCEVDKYARVFHPEVHGLSGRERIKQTFRPAGTRIRYWFPPKWGLNDLAGLG